MERMLKQNNESANLQNAVQAKFTSKSRENEFENNIVNSPVMVAQREKLQNLFGGAIQRQGAEEEPLQGKFGAVQRIEDEEPLQGKFDTAQRVEEEEPLQGKFGAAQRIEEEEPLQGKFEAVQRVEEEEPLQGKSNIIQTKHELGEEEFLPGKFGGAQRVEDEEPLQAKFDAVQRIEEEEPLQGKLALGQLKTVSKDNLLRQNESVGAAPVQRVVYPTMAAMWGAVHPAYALANIANDSTLNSLYHDAEAQLPNVDFQQVGGMAPQIASTPLAAQPYRIDWDTAANLGHDNHFFAGEIIHELAHAASSQQYTRNGANQGDLIWVNMNLPAPVGVVNPLTGLAPNQLLAAQNQRQTLINNWNDLDAEALVDSNAGTLTAGQYAHISGRIQYAGATSDLHNETVLGDIMYYLLANNLENCRTYKFAKRMLKEANDRRQNGFWSNQGTNVRRVDRQAWWFQFWKW
jgi:hypothetical protein